MKRIKTVSIAIAFLLAGASLSALAGCSPADTNGTSNGDGKSAVTVVPVSVAELEEPVYGEPFPAAGAVAGGANDFAFKLSAALAEQSGGQNLVCSPYSVWIPLAALLNATDAQSKDALLSAIGASGIREEDVNKAASRMLYDLTKQRDKEFLKEQGESGPDPLKIANAIFVDKRVTLKKDFAQTFMDSYRGNAMNVDFASEDAVAAVNKWASENTEGLITDIVQEFDPSAVAAIANAIYFSDRWDREFDADKTEEDIFYSPAGETKASYMLREGDAQLYYEDDRVQAMPLQFTTGGGLYIILPKNGGAAELLSSMTSAYFSKIQADQTASTGKLLLPRFSVESDVMELKDTLTALGVLLFDEAAAPLTGGLIEGNIPVWLSSAVHKAVVKVDEKGTTAAAVTVMSLNAGSAMPQPTEPFEMTCNKPFVFVLYDRTYDGGSQILFTGIVNQP
ncbi:MAG: hypothetical protein LBS85_07350 [Clostridiales Family XIII bacterium]|jgi:serpin B|nr:hypothetical protein [Clostridiales Family XIII bacterium]